MPENKKKIKCIEDHQEWECNTLKVIRYTDDTIKIKYRNSSYYFGTKSSFGEAEGEGILYRYDKTKKWEGKFSDDYLTDGIEYRSDGNSIKYIGEMNHGWYYGKGKLFYPNGNIHIDGSFDMNKPVDGAKYHYPNGHYYQGPYDNYGRKGTSEYYSTALQSETLDSNNLGKLYTKDGIKIFESSWYQNRPFGYYVEYDFTGTKKYRSKTGLDNNGCIMYYYDDNEQIKETKFKDHLGTWNEDIGYFK